MNATRELKIANLSIASGNVSANVNDTGLKIREKATHMIIQ